MNDPKRIVRTGYDLLSAAYREDHPDEDGESYRQYASWLERLSSRIEPGVRVLDLGCGCGVPVASILASGFQVTGVDFSDVQIDRARRLVPKATFLCSDMAIVEFDADSFEAVVCLYSLFHLPIEEQRPFLRRVHCWIAQKGFLLITVGENEWTGVETDWLNVQGGDMYWSHASQSTYEQWFAEIGFVVEWVELIPEGNVRHPLFLLRKR